MSRAACRAGTQKVCEQNLYQAPSTTAQHHYPAHRISTQQPAPLPSAPAASAAAAPALTIIRPVGGAVGGVMCGRAGSSAARMQSGGAALRATASASPT